MLTFTFAFDDFESLLLNFGLVRTGSNFGNFGLGDGKSWKSQYRSYLISKVLIYFSGPNQGILKGEVSLYCWPPVWLVWNQLYDNWNFCFYLQNRLIQTSQTGGQWYSDTSPFSIPCSNLNCNYLTIGKIFSNALAYCRYM